MRFILFMSAAISGMVLYNYYNIQCLKREIDIIDEKYNNLINIAFQKIDKSSYSIVIGKKKKID